MRSGNPGRIFFVYTVFDKIGLVNKKKNGIVPFLIDKNT